MLSIKILASILMVLHIASVGFIGMVIRRQLALFKIPVAANIVRFRRVLFTLSVIILVGNVIPIVIDALTLFVETGRPHNLRIISIMYGVSNAFTALVSAYLIWRLYRLAADTKILSDQLAFDVKETSDQLAVDTKETSDQLATDTKAKTDATGKRLTKERDDK